MIEGNEINDIHSLYKVTKNKLEGQHGVIQISLANRTRIYGGNDVVGNCLQEWLPEWFEKLGIDIVPGRGTQVFPDFVALFDDKKYDVEIKAWNCNNSPAFDLSNFESFLESTFKAPNKVEAYYFVLGYKPANDNFSQGFVLEKVFLKRIWEMTYHTKKYPINLQVKRGKPYAMRPSNFYKYPERHFNNKFEFIDAVKDTYEKFSNKNLKFSPSEWKRRVYSYFMG